MEQYLERKVESEQILLLYQNLNSALSGNLLVLVCLAWASREQMHTWGMMLAIAGCILFFLRYLDGLQLSGNPRSIREHPRYWERRYATGLLLTGTFWGLVFYGIIENQNPEMNFFVMCFFGAIVSIGGATTAARFPVYLYLILPICGLVMIKFFLLEGMLYRILFLALFAFIAINVVVNRNYNRIISKSIYLRYENAFLIAKLEQEKSRAEENQALAEDAMRSKDKFLAAASHDLRQPLHAQSLYLDIIQDYISPAGLESLTALKKTNLTLSELFNKVLDVSRLNAGIVIAKQRHFHLTDVTASLMEEFRQGARAKGLLLEEKADDGAIIHTDPVLLAQILRNILANAIRYTDQGSISLSCQVRNSYVSISISDTGKGIPPAEQQKIFQEYYQLQNPERDRNKGLGLGLAIVAKMCKLLALEIKCDSIPGRGSTFTLNVPCGHESEVAPEHLPINYKILDQARILVIDDELDILQGMELLLTSWGLQTLSAESEADAILKIRTACFRPDLIIADYRLRNDKTGAEAIAGIRRLLAAEIPALLITGDTSEERLQEADTSGLLILHKPLQPMKLRPVLYSLLHPGPGRPVSSQQPAPE
ncbi:MAG TPA: ATP-binding protein [Thiolinea sp.]|nr:ATP-binding protein [Thiolinea sp.]